MSFAKVSTRYYSNKNSSGKIALKLRLTVNKRRYELYPQIVIEEHQWNKTNQKIRGLPNAHELNDSLDEFKRICRSVESQLREEIGEYSKTQLTEAVKTAWLHGDQISTSGVPKRFWDFFDYFIKYKEATGHDRKHTVGHYVRLKNILKQFNSSLEWSDLTDEFYEEFMDFCEMDLNHGINYLSKHLNYLKAVINEAQRRRIEAALRVHTDRWKEYSEPKRTPTLSLDELEALFNLDLTENPTLDKVRNLFYFACWTALRPSDFTQVDKNNIDGDSIRLRQRKTSKNASKKEDLILPIHYNLKRIIDKVGGIPESLSSQHMNQHLPILGKMIGMTEMMTIIKQNRRGEQTQYQKPRYELLKCRCARKTFATNRSACGLSIQEAMLFTGHKTETAFRHYVMEDEKAQLEAIREKLNKLK